MKKIIITFISLIIGIFSRAQTVNEHYYFKNLSSQNGLSQNTVSAGGGMGGKMTPSAVLVIKDGSVRMVPVNNNDPVSKIIDMAPDVIHRFMNKSEDDAAVESAVEHISEEE